MGGVCRQLSVVSGSSFLVGRGSANQDISDFYIMTCRMDRYSANMFGWLATPGHQPESYWRLAMSWAGTDVNLETEHSEILRRLER